MSSISAGTTTGTALVSTGDTTGQLDLKINGTTQAVRINTSGAIGVGTSPDFGTSGQVLTSGGSSAAPSWSDLPAPAGSITATASGSLANGDRVIVNSNGTVSVVAGTEAQTGTQVTIATGVYKSAAVYDSANSKVVVCYYSSSTSYGYAAVGTVSGTSISFGTPVMFSNSAGISSVAATYDSSNSKVVICYYASATSYGYAVVGTVSGTSISFGTPVMFSGTILTNEPAITFDSSNNKIVIAYATTGSATATAIVGTVSGTSISFGSAVTIKPSGSSNYFAITFNTSASKVVVVFADGTTSNTGTAVVGTVSGTSISFGSLYEFTATSSAISASSVCYDSTANKVIIAYRLSSSGIGYATVTTVSGTTLTFGTAATFSSSVGIGSGIDLCIAYNAYINKTIVSYRLASNDYGYFNTGTVSGTTISFTTPTAFSSQQTFACVNVQIPSSITTVFTYYYYTSDYYEAALVYNPLNTNLTSSNFIGFSNAAYTNGQTATIQTVGSVDDAQSGLTAGQLYYVQPSGTLSTTAYSGITVVAGTAISATQIIIKG